MDGEDYNGGRWHPIWAYGVFRELGMEKTAWFSLFHSRFMVKYHETFNKAYLSKLAIADKLAVVFTPLWIYTEEELKEYTLIEGYNISWDKDWFKNQQLRLWKEQVDKKCLAFVEEWKDKAYDLQQY